MFWFVVLVDGDSWRCITLTVQVVLVDWFVVSVPFAVLVGVVGGLSSYCCYCYIVVGGVCWLVGSFNFTVVGFVLYSLR